MKTYIYLLVFFPVLLFAQEIPEQVNEDFKLQIENAYQNIDLSESEIQTGIFTDYGFTLTNLEKFDGILTDTNIVNTVFWKAIYSDLYASRVNNNSSDMVPISEISATVFAPESFNIPILYYEYNQFKKDAISNNLLKYENGQFSDLSPTGVTLYDKKEVFAVTSSVPFVENGFSITVNTSLDYFFTNIQTSINSLQIDFDNGEGYKSISIGNQINISYSTPGEKILKFKISFSNGKILHSHSAFFVRDVVDTSLGKKGSNLDERPHERIEIPESYVKSYLGKKNTANVDVFYSGDTEILDKPFIVFEGFDANHILGTPNFDYESFFENYNDVLDSLSNSELIPIGSPMYSTIEGLFADGYDIVFVDWENGTDYIQRNAFLAEAIIRTINERKNADGSAEENVVMGMSMGGLIARYALADMEQNGEGVDHETRLYISMDSPHQGANVPPAFQALSFHIAELSNYKVKLGIPGLVTYGWNIRDIIDTFGGDSDENFADLDAAFKMLLQPASRQMLKYQVNWGHNQTLIWDNSIHNEFMQEYNNLGFPQSTRNIAISNSNSVTNSGYRVTPHPYEPIMLIDGNYKFTFWENAVMPIAAVLGLSITSNAYDHFWYSLMSLIPLGGHSLIIDFNLHALPQKQNKEIYKGQIKAKKTVLGFTIAQTNLTYRSLNSTTDQIALSSSRGGTYSLADMGGLTEEGINEAIQNFVEVISVSNMVEDFSFVPGFSALDLEDPNTSTGFNAEGHLAGTQFDNIFTDPVVNGEDDKHTLFRPGMTNWILGEVRQDPTIIHESIINKKPLENAEVITDCYCNNENSINTHISNIPYQIPDSEIKWSVSQGLVIIGGNTGRDITIRALDNNGSQEKVTLNVYDEFREVNAWKGKPKIFSYDSFGNKNYMGGSASFTKSYSTGEIEVFADSHVDSWSWELYNDNITWTFWNNKATFYRSIEGNYNFTAKATNKCGETLYFYIVSIGGLGSGIGPMLIGPNPTDNYLTITNTSLSKQVAPYSSNTKSLNNDIISLTFYDSQYNIIFVGELTDEITWDTSNLKDGIYYLHLIKGDIIEKRQIIISHK